MSGQIPEEPKFIKTATAIQKWLAGVSVSMFLIVWVTGWDIVSNVFKPDFIKALTYVRMSIALISIIIASIVGYQQIRNIIDWLVDSWELYKKISEIKKDKDK